jgi:hypothetical protein
MRTVELEVMLFTELEDSAKDNARAWYREGSEFPWFDEYLASIRAFCGEFGVTLKDWCIGDSYRAFLKTNAEPHHFRGYRLKDAEKLKAKELTGFCGDCITEEFYKVFSESGDAFYAFNQTLEHALIDIRKDVEGFYSDESVDEMLEVNQYEFYPNGKIYH